MMNLPPKEEFYQKRDDRTSAETDCYDYQSASILVSGGRCFLESYQGRVLTRTLTNLLSRFGRDVDLAFPNTPTEQELPSRGDTLTSQCLNQMESANPYGDFNQVEDGSGRAYDCIIVIGNSDIDTKRTPTIFASCDGWIARISRDKPRFTTKSESRNPVGGMVTACFAGAEAFKTVNEFPETQLSEEVKYDVFYHKVGESIPNQERPVIPSTINIGTLRMIGVGSVGSAVVHFLGRLPVSGNLQLVDYDRVELVNLNRSPLFEAVHAIEGLEKVEAAEESIDSPDLEVSTFCMGYSEFNSEDGETADLLLPLANEDNVRWDIQHSRPPLMLHATTSGADVTLRRNIPVDDACLLCHFPQDSDRVNAPCATGPGNEQRTDSQSDSDPDAALPFASFLAGAFVVAELVKVSNDEYPITRSITRVQTLTNIEDGVLQYDKNREDECAFCSDSTPEVHLGQIEDTTFDHLTTFNESS